MGAIVRQSRSALEQFDPPPHSDSNTSASKTLIVPHDRLVALEHPCIVKHVDKAVKALGGEHQVKHIVNEDDNTLPAATSLRPDDPLAKKILSQKSDVHHLLLRVNVPKRTGRKRKRGSDRPFDFHHSAASNGRVITGISQNDAGDELPLKADQFVRALSKISQDYQLQPVGVVRSVHRFRNLPDFQMISQDNGIMRQVVHNLGSTSLDHVKGFRPDMSVQTQPSTILGPPLFAAHNQQLYYGYAQNRNMGAVASNGQISSATQLQARRRVGLAVPYDILDIPTEMPAGLPPLEDNAALRVAVKHLTDVLQTRPIITRRAAMNLVPDMSEDLFKLATQYCGYAFRSGPWRDTLVRFGIDPRTSPEYRPYQTLSFQISTKDKALTDAKKLVTGSNQWLRSYKVARNRKSIRMGSDVTPKTKKSGATFAGEAHAGAVADGEQMTGSENDEEDMPSHIFDGRGIGTNTKTFQIIDITDPLLAEHFATAPLRDQFHSALYGWYTNGVISVARAVMRDKIGHMLAGDDLTIWEGVWTRAVKMTPTIIDHRNKDSTYRYDSVGLSDDEKRKLGLLMSQVRDLAKTDVEVFQRGKKKGKGKHTRSDSEKEGEDDSGDGGGDEDEGQLLAGGHEGFSEADDEEDDDDGPDAVADLEAVEHMDD